MNTRRQNNTQQETKIKNTWQMMQWNYVKEFYFYLFMSQLYVNKHDDAHVQESVSLNQTETSSFCSMTSVCFSFTFTSFIHQYMCSIYIYIGFRIFCFSPFYVTVNYSFIYLFSVLFCRVIFYYILLYSSVLSSITGSDSPTTHTKDVTTHTRAMKLKHQDLQDRLEICLLELKKLCIREAVS